MAKFRLHYMRSFEWRLWEDFDTSVVKELRVKRIDNLQEVDLECEEEDGASEEIQLEFSKEQ